MKIKLTKYALAVLAITFALTSCSKNEDAISSIENAKQDILTFTSVQEFDSTIVKINSMKPEERVAWEKSKGFKSFGTICDEFYASVNIDKFKSEAEFLEYVKTNSEYIQIIEHSDSSKCLETQEFDNTSRYLMNKNRMYIIGNIAYKKLDEGCIVTSTSNIKTLTTAKDFNSLKLNPAFAVSYVTSKKTIQKISTLKAPMQKISATILGNDYGDWDNHTGYKNRLYRIEIYLRTYPYFEQYWDPYANFGSGGWVITLSGRNTSCLIKNYYQGALGIWTSIQRITTYNVTVNTNDYFNMPRPYSCSQNNQTIDTWSAPWSIFILAGGYINEVPYFTYINYDAYNDEGCRVTHVYQ